jgi:putative peptidoglycan lipid II flippase
MAEDRASGDKLTGDKLTGAFRQIVGLTAASRVLGFLRDIAFAAFLGAGPASDAFLVALKLPNLFRRLTADGAMTNAFLPAYSALKSQQGKKAALLLAAEIQVWLLLALCGLVVLAELFMPLVIDLLAPGFAETPDRRQAAIDLARITIPYLPMISAVALWAAISNAHDRFFGGAAAPVILNIFLIGGALAIPLLGLNGPGSSLFQLALPLAIGLILAGLCQMLLLWQALGQLAARPKLAGFSVSFSVSPAGRRMWRSFVPAALGAGTLQINLLVDMVLASLLPTGAISWLYYSDRLAQLPLGVVGIALGTALLPQLSALEAAKKPAQIAPLLARGLRLAGFFAFPSMAALLVLAPQLISGLFGRGAFDDSDVIAAAAALMAYGCGLPAYIFSKILQPAFYAADRGREALFIALAAVVLNIIASLILMQFFGHVGLALATALAGWLVMLAQAGWLVRQRRLDASSLPVLLRGVLAALVLAGGLWLLAGLEAIAGLGAIAGMLVLVLAGLVGWFVLARLAGIIPPELFSLLPRLANRSSEKSGAKKSAAKKSGTKKSAAKKSGAKKSRAK